MILCVNNADGKSVVFGTRENNIFYKRVSKKEHLFLLLQAWGLDYRMFESHVLDCKEIRILDTDDNTIYVCSPRHFAKHGEIREFGNHGKQIFLPLSKFTTETYHGRLGLKY
jgi:hypothetical protein